MVALVQRREFKLTGRARVRSGWFGRRVLQVEVLTQAFSPWRPCPPPPNLDDAAREKWKERERNAPPDNTWTSWRDATWLDLQERGRFVIEPNE